MKTRIAIIGGGIAGLAAAHRVHELSPTTEISLFDSAARLGGVIQTRRQQGFLVESAADNFITTNPSALNLCKRLGIGDEIMATRPSGCGAMVLSRGRLRPVPPGFMVMAPSRLMPMLTTRILSTRGKLRAAMERFTPPRREQTDESLESFASRRFGREVLERLVQPHVGGIYTADPQRLSVAATMPRFLEMEREHGSLLKAMMRQRKTRATRSTEERGGARYSQFVSLRNGMSSLIRELADSLPDGSIHLRRRVRSVVPNGCGGWSVRIQGDETFWEEFDGVIVASPAHQAASVLTTCDRQLATELSQIKYASCAVVSLAYRRDQIDQPIDSFGFVVPLKENRLILSCSFSSLKYSGRAPDGSILMRVFVGGACQRGLLRLPHEELIELAEREIADVLGVKGSPVFRDVTMQTRAMPQYHVGHRQRIERIRRHLDPHESLAIAGSAIDGVGVPGCIESGERASERVVKAVVEGGYRRRELACC